MSLGYLDSGLWSLKQCHVQVLAHRVGSSQTRPRLVTPTRFVLPLPQHIFQGQIVDQRFCVCVGIYFSFLVAYRGPFHVIDSRMWGWRFYVGTDSTFPCSMSCVGVVFCKGPCCQFVDPNRIFKRRLVDIQDQWKNSIPPWEEIGENWHWGNWIFSITVLKLEMEPAKLIHWYSSTRKICFSK